MREALIIWEQINLGCVRLKEYISRRYVVQEAAGGYMVGESDTARQKNRAAVSSWCLSNF